MPFLPREVVCELQRACAEENYQCVGAKQSYGDFIHKQLPDRLRQHKVTARLDYQLEMGVGGAGYMVEVTFDNVHIGTPMSIDARGEVNLAMTPSDARLTNQTYASAVYADVHTHTEEPVGSKSHGGKRARAGASAGGGVAYKGDTARRVYLGTIPVMVGSTLCTTRTSAAALAREIDPGGYFIIQGELRWGALRLCVCVALVLYVPTSH